MNRGAGGGRGEHNQINYCSTDFIAFPDADRCFIFKTQSVIEFLLNISNYIYLIELGRPSLEIFLKTVSIPKALKY